MVVCPVAMAVGCRKCPVFGICPAKSVIGDYKPDNSAAAAKAKSTSARNNKKK